MGEEMRVAYELKCEQRFGKGGVGAFGGDGIILKDVLGALSWAEKTIFHTESTNFVIPNNICQLSEYYTQNN